MTNKLQVIGLMAQHDESFLMPLLLPVRLIHLSLTTGILFLRRMLSQKWYTLQKNIKLFKQH